MGALDALYKRLSFKTLYLLKKKKDRWTTQQFQDWNQGLKPVQRVKIKGPAA